MPPIRIFSGILLIFTLDVNAANALHQIPSKLFGITLGSIYNIVDHNTQEFNVGDMPIKKLRGVKEQIMGTFCYFEPLKVNNFFPYIEKKKNSGDELF